MKGLITWSLIFAIVVSSSFAFRCPTQGIYAHLNPNIFYVCSEPNTEALIAFCENDKGFLQNDLKTGCIFFDEWECTNKIGKNPPKCTNLNAEYPHLNPNKYWKCTNNNEPQIMQCPENQGYIADIGCLHWPNWYCKDRNEL